MTELSNMGEWFPFPIIRAFKSHKKAARYYKTLTGEKLDRIQNDKLAEVHYLENDESCKWIAFVVFDGKRIKNDSIAQKYGIIAHECSHIVDHMMEDLGEDDPSTEFRAYALQSAMMTVVDQLGEEWLTRKA